MKVSLWSLWYAFSFIITNTEHHFKLLESNALGSFYVKIIVFKNFYLKKFLWLFFEVNYLLISQSSKITILKIKTSSKTFSLPLWSSVQFSSVAQLCPTLCDPMNCSTPGLSVHHQLPEFTQIHVHWVGDAIQPSHPLSSPSPPAPNPSQLQSLFQWVNSSHEVAKVLEFQL